jgi:hypothetical protein
VSVVEPMKISVIDMEEFEFTTPERKPPLNGKYAKGGNSVIKSEEAWEKVEKVEFQSEEKEFTLV